MTSWYWTAIRAAELAQERLAEAEDQRLISRARRNRRRAEGRRGLPDGTRGRVRDSAWAAGGGAVGRLFGRL